MPLLSRRESEGAVFPLGWKRVQLVVRVRRPKRRRPRDAVSALYVMPYVGCYSYYHDQSPNSQPASLC